MRVEGEAGAGPQGEREPDAARLGAEAACCCVWVVVVVVVVVVV